MPIKDEEVYAAFTRLVNHAEIEDDVDNLIIVGKALGLTDEELKEEFELPPDEDEDDPDDDLDDEVS